MSGRSEKAQWTLEVLYVNAKLELHLPSTETCRVTIAETPRPFVYGTGNLSRIRDTGTCPVTVSNELVDGACSRSGALPLDSHEHGASYSVQRPSFSLAHDSL